MGKQAGISPSLQFVPEAIAKSLPLFPQYHRNNDYHFWGNWG
jgi:hypothetical protein